jgi:hypothetical protein
MVHCPKCDASFEAQDQTHAETVCPRCGATGAATSGAPVAVAADSRGGGFSLSGRPGILRWTKNVAVRLVRSVCPVCGQKIGPGMPACPHCGCALKKSPAPPSGELGPALRKMLIAATVFIGIPAAIIVFILVVCAPEGGDVAPKAGRPPRPAPIAERTEPPSAQPQKADAERPESKGSLRSVLRSVRDRLRGSEHGSSSVPAKTSLEKPGQGPSDSNVPPVGTRDGQQVKPDPAR